ncbi:hypothetical protein BDZ91DRAFT_761533 [Kalaharituber pfeilii]|nr:hypothetical protein BDZ91DRAFT_761533 [Kalaharituber pfeilii]
MLEPSDACNQLEIVSPVSLCFTRIHPLWLITVDLVDPECITLVHKAVVPDSDLWSGNRSISPVKKNLSPFDSLNIGTGATYLWICHRDFTTQRVKENAGQKRGSKSVIIGEKIPVGYFVFERYFGRCTGEIKVLERRRSTSKQLQLGILFAQYKNMVQGEWHRKNMGEVL